MERLQGEQLGFTKINPMITPPTARSPDFTAGSSDRLITMSLAQHPGDLALWCVVGWVREAVAVVTLLPSPHPFHILKSQVTW